MFETVLRMSVPGELESQVRRRSFPLSIAVHALFIAGVAWLSALSARTRTESTESAVPVVFFRGSDDPGAPAPPRGNPLPDRGPDVVSRRVETASSPTSDQDAAPAEEPSSVAAGDQAASADSGGDPSGKDDGKPSGISGGDGDHDGRDFARSRERILAPGGDVLAPRLLWREEPPYPELARKAHLEGTVILEAVIGFSGSVEDLHVVRSASLLLDAAALEAVRRWRYSPATLGGRPVRVYLAVTVAFRLR